MNLLAVDTAVGSLANQAFRRAEDIHHSLNRLRVDLYSLPLEYRKLQLAGVFRDEISVFVAHRSVQVDLGNAPPSCFQEQLV